MGLETHLGPSFHLHPYLLCASSEGPGETVELLGKKTPVNSDGILTLCILMVEINKLRIVHCTYLGV